MPLIAALQGVAWMGSVHAGGQDTTVLAAKRTSDTSAHICAHIYLLTVGSSRLFCAWSGLWLLSPPLGHGCESDRAYGQIVTSSTQLPSD